jgi:hypothetical protein
LDLKASKLALLLEASTGMCKILWLTLSVAEQCIISCTGPVDPIVATTAPLGDATTRGTETCGFFNTAWEMQQLLSASLLQIIRQ